MKYRDFTIKTRMNGPYQKFDVTAINCFGCYSIEEAKSAIDRYLDGDSDSKDKHIRANEW